MTGHPDARTGHPDARDAGGQLGLFGDPPPVPQQRGRSGRVSRIESNDVELESNDVELMVTVAANAARCGYLLVGAAERVYARTDADDRVVRVPRYEDDAVHQLLRRRWLTLGSTHRVTCGAAHLIGAAVLVPKATRERIEHWNRLHRPPSWPDHHRESRTPPSDQPAPGEPVCALCQDTGRVPDSRQTRWTPDLGVHRPDTTSPCPWCARQSSPPRRAR